MLQCYVKMSYRSPPEKTLLNYLVNKPVDMVKKMSLFITGFVVQALTRILSEIFSPEESVLLTCRR